MYVEFFKVMAEISAHIFMSLPYFLFSVNFCVLH